MSAVDNIDNKLPISSSQYSLQTNGANGANSINKQEEAVFANSNLQTQNHDGTQLSAINY